MVVEAMDDSKSGFVLIPETGNRHQSSVNMQSPCNSCNKLSKIVVRALLLCKFFGAKSTETSFKNYVNFLE